MSPLGLVDFCIISRFGSHGRSRTDFDRPEGVDMRREPVRLSKNGLTRTNCPSGC
uniref:Uncharacterized protein n=1 Tax=Physcomitrium patens TaxID=3218 RepID=A0A2K1J3J0_PHYPA|nr:hypothetical protein PHYPA_021940 [Physcomitrium patens]